MEPAAPEPLSMETIAVPPDARRCQNCGKPLLGDHCYSCGQPTKGLVRQFSSIVGDFLDSVFEWDSRTVRTVGPLLYRPGHLTTEYFAGRRVRYVSPVRLFVFLCLVSFFALQFAVDIDIPGGTERSTPFDDADSVEQLEQIRDERLQTLRAEQAGASARAAERIEFRITRLQSDAERHLEWLRLRDAAREARLAPPPPPSTPLSEPTLRFNDREWHPETNPLHFDRLPDAGNAWLNSLIGRAKVNIGKIERNPGMMIETFLQTLPQTFFVLLPLFALLLKVAYLFRRRLYMEHLIVALHSHAFLCLVLLMVLALGGLRGMLDGGAVATPLGWAERALLLWVPVYLWLMQKRVYRQGVIMTTLKFCVIGLLYVFLLSLGAAVNLMTNLVTM
jgi:hypothetical protein